MELNYQSRLIIANRSNRRWIIVFVILAVIIISGVALLILPSTEFRVKLAEQLIEAQITIKLDLDVNQVIPKLGVVPAFVSGEQVSAVLKNKQYINFSYQGQLVSYKQSDYEEVLSYHLKAFVPSGYLLIDSLQQKNLSVPEVAESGSQFNWQVKASQAAIRDVPLELWQDKIKSLSVVEVQKWLQAQPGVEKVELYEKYNFLAKISRILFSHNQRYIITLDR